MRFRVQPIYVAYALLGLFLAIEPLLRQGKAARSRKAGAADRGSTQFIGATFGLGFIAMLMAPLLNRWKIGLLRREALAWAGIPAMLAGLTLRIWAARVLGAFYTRTLQTSEEQHLIRNGPYQAIRHPGYLADILMWLGAGVTTANWLAPVFFVAPMIGAY